MSKSRYTVSDVTKARFYQMPKFLFEKPYKKELSNDAKVLYSLLKDRHESSLKNGWVNENEEVYLIYTRQEMADMLGCSQPTLRKAIHQLLENGLLEEERMGFNRANRLYLTTVSPENTGVKESFIPECKNLSYRSEKNFHSGVKESFILECKNLSPNDTNINKTNKNDIIFSPSVTLDNQEKRPTAKKEEEKQKEVALLELGLVLSETKKTKESLPEKELLVDVQAKLHQQIDFEDLKYTHPSDHALLDEIELNILEMYFSEYTKVKGEKKPQAIIRLALMRLTYFHIEELIDKCKGLKTRLIAPKAYLQTMIYSIAFENQTQTVNAVAVCQKE